MEVADNRLKRAVLMAGLVLHEVNDLGPAAAVAIGINSVRSGREQRRARRATSIRTTPRPPGLLRSVETVWAHPADGVVGQVVGARCLFAETELEVRFLAPDLVRLTWGWGDPPLPWALGGPLTTGTSLLAVRVTTDGTVSVTVSTAALAVVVGAEGDVSWQSPDGTTIRRDRPPLHRGATSTLVSPLRPGERVCGLGEQAGQVDLRGTRHRLWNRDPGGAWGPGDDPLYCVIPVLVGLHPGGDVLAFFENSHDGEVRIDDGRPLLGEPAVSVTFAGGALRYYVAAGPLPVLLERYGDLTGRPPLPPRWALGYHQCRWGYKDEATVRAVAAGFAAEGLPLSAIHLDIDYMDGYRVFTVDRHRFPDLSALGRDLAARGTALVAIIDPAVKADPGDDLYRQGEDHGRFVRDPDGRTHLGTVWPGWSAFPDFTDPATRAWWSDQYRVLTDQGVAGVWHDMNEPTSIALWGDRTLPKATRHAAEGRGGDHGEAHNVYGLLMDKAGFEALATDGRGRRPFVLSRSGWAGLGRWAFHWTGDIESSWAGLRQQVATIVGLGLSGVAFTGSDIGGFSGEPTPELYLRWLELSVFGPFCRTHSMVGMASREPWRFPEPYRAAVGRLIRLRYRLLPYLYTLAEEAARTGHPLVRPLCWPAEVPSGAGSSADPRLADVGDAYFLGPSLLVAPVTTAGAGERAVPLPDSRWFLWRLLPPLGVADLPEVGRSRASQGGATVTVPCPPGQPALAVRSGTVLPLDDGWGDPGAHDGVLEPGHAPRTLAFHCFPAVDGSASGTHYDDAGDGDGPGRRDEVALSGSGPTKTLRWRRTGCFAPPARVRVVLHGVEVRGASTDGDEVPVTVSGGGPEHGPVSTLDCPAFDELTLRTSGRTVPSGP